MQNTYQLCWFSILTNYRKLTRLKTILTYYYDAPIVQSPQRIPLDSNPDPTGLQPSLVALRQNLSSYLL